MTSPTHDATPDHLSSLKWTTREKSWIRALSRSGLENQNFSLSSWSVRLFGTVGGNRGANLASLFERLGFEKASRARGSSEVELWSFGPAAQKAVARLAPDPIETDEFRLLLARAADFAQAASLAQQLPAGADRDALCSQFQGQLAQALREAARMSPAAKPLAEAAQSKPSAAPRRPR